MELYQDHDSQMGGSEGNHVLAESAKNEDMGKEENGEETERRKEGEGHRGTKESMSSETSYSRHMDKLKISPVPEADWLEEVSSVESRGDGEVKTETGLQRTSSTQCPLTCPYCRACFLNDSSLQKHDCCAAAGDKPYACGVCRTTCLHPRELKKHMKTHREFSCDQCPATFTSQYRAQRHKFAHTQDRPFPCPRCDVGFKSNAELKRHLSMQHKVEGMLRFVCPECDTRFFSRSLLEKHARTHAQGKTYMCSVCDLTFLCSANLRAHRRQAHTGEKRFACKDCDAAFELLGTLKVHRLRTHQANPPPHFQCQHCECKFITQSALDRHAYTHTNAKGFPCRLCKAVFSRISSLKTHLKHIHPSSPRTKPFRCSDCDAVFSVEFAAKRHWRRMHSDDPVNPGAQKAFPCAHCNAVFGKDSRMKEHVRKNHASIVASQQGSKVEGKITSVTADWKAAPSPQQQQQSPQSTPPPEQVVSVPQRAGSYPCNECNAVFKFPGHLGRHFVQKHSSGQSLPFACLSCEDSFNSRQSLKKHVTKKHPD